MNFNEKRKAQRKRLHLQVFCWETDGQKKTRPIELQTKDVSPDGLAFICKKEYPVGSILYAEIFLPGHKKPLGCSLQIVSVELRLKSDEYVMGASFVGLNSGDRILLANYIDKLDLYALLDSALAGGASDLHLTVGRPPMARRDGQLLTMAADIIEPGQIEAMLYPLLTMDKINEFENNKELDFAFSPTMNSRFRVNLHYQRGFVEAVLRNIPSTVKSFLELGLPEEHLTYLCKQTKGLILIAGTTGSGKTTTLSSMVDYINQNYSKVIVTVENPIEYIIHPHTSIVKQRELGSDTRSYQDALRHVLRQDPDVICVGELIGAESFMAAMQAAETGRLVISTIHAPDTVSAVERAINFFEPEYILSICNQLSSCLNAVLYQALIPAQAGGRVVATELLVNNSAIKNMIKENRYKQLGTVLQTGKPFGMYTFQNSIKTLLKNGLIDQEEAMKHINVNEK